MELQDIFDQLTYGELANLSIGGEDSGGISEANAPKVISHINMALSALSVKFKYIEQEQIIILESGTTYYDIQPFIITGVYDESGNVLPLNNPSDPNSVYNPRWDTLQVPESVAAAEVHVTYQVKPTKLALDAIVAETEIDLPDILLEPLLAYVAGRVYTSKGTQEGMQTGMAQMSKFELLCKQLKAKGVLDSNEQITNTNLENNGWL